MPDLDRRARLARFKAAQDSPHGGFESALHEIQSGAKTGHWIWYVFPQLAGLGSSGLSQTFAIDDEDEAIEFLRDPELRSRLFTIVEAVAAQIGKGRGRSLRTLMGSDIDARKVVSSLTLFGHVARKLHEREGLTAYGSFTKVADDVMAAAALEGYPPCSYTLGQLGGSEAGGAI
jgi:uncharacterized protein (DUF1810 family)